MYELSDNAKLLLVISDEHKNDSNMSDYIEVEVM